VGVVGVVGAAGVVAVDAVDGGGLAGPSGTPFEQPAATSASCAVARRNRIERMMNES